MFTAALFKKAKVWKQPESINGWTERRRRRRRGRRKSMVYVYGRILPTMKKEWNIAIWDNMDGSQRNYAKQNGRWERQILYNFTYMWSLKNKTNKQAKKKKSQIKRTEWWFPERSRGSRWRGQEVPTFSYKINKSRGCDVRFQFCKMGKILEVGCTTMRMYSILLNYSLENC